MSEDMMWFFAVFFFTVPPVLRFRENFLVPSLATLLVFGFYTQGFWMPDFYKPSDWLWIGAICVNILACYFICGFFVHYFWFKHTSAHLSKGGAFGPLLKAWMAGKYYIIEENYVAEIRRLRMFEVNWADVQKVSGSCENGVVYFSLTDGEKREKEILSEVKISTNSGQFKVLSNMMVKKLSWVDQNWIDQAVQNSFPNVAYNREAK